MGNSARSIAWKMKTQMYGKSGKKTGRRIFMYVEQSMED